MNKLLKNSWNIKQTFDAQQELANRRMKFKGRTIQEEKPIVRKRNRILTETTLNNSEKNNDTIKKEESVIKSESQNNETTSKKKDSIKSKSQKIDEITSEQTIKSKSQKIDEITSEQTIEIQNDSQKSHETTSKKEESAIKIESQKSHETTPDQTIQIQNESKKIDEATSTKKDSIKSDSQKSHEATSTKKDSIKSDSQKSHETTSEQKDSESDQSSKQSNKLETSSSLDEDEDEHVDENGVEKISKLSVPGFRREVEALLKGVIESWFSDIQFPSVDFPDTYVILRKHNLEFMKYKLENTMDEDIKQDMLTIYLDNGIYESSLRIQVLKNISPEMIIYIQNFLSLFMMKTSQIVVSTAEISDDVKLVLNKLYGVTKIFDTDSETSTSTSLDDENHKSKVSDSIKIDDNDEDSSKDKIIQKRRLFQNKKKLDKGYNKKKNIEAIQERYLEDLNKKKPIIKNPNSINESDSQKSQSIDLNESNNIQKDVTSSIRNESDNQKSEPIDLNKANNSQKAVTSIKNELDSQKSTTLDDSQKTVTSIKMDSVDDASKRNYYINVKDGEEEAQQVDLKDYFTNKELQMPEVVLRNYKDGYLQSDNIFKFQLVSNDPNFDVIDGVLEKIERLEYMFRMSNSYFTIVNKFNVPTKKFITKNIEMIIKQVEYKLTNIKKINHLLVKENTEMLLDFKYPPLMMKKAVWTLMGHYMVIVSKKDLTELVHITENDNELIMEYKDDIIVRDRSETLAKIVLKKSAEDEIEIIEAEAYIYIEHHLKMISRKTYPKESMFNMFAMLESLIHETIADVKRIYYDNSLDMIEAFANPTRMQTEALYNDMEKQNIDTQLATGVTPLPEPGVTYFYEIGPAIKTKFNWEDTVKHHGKFGYSYDYAGFESQETVNTFEYYLIKMSVPELAASQSNIDDSQTTEVDDESQKNEDKESVKSKSTNSASYKKKHK